MVKCGNKDVMICHYVAPSIANYYASNMAAIFLNCILEKLQPASLSHADI